MELARVVVIPNAVSFQDLFSCGGKKTYILISWTAVNSSGKRGGIVGSPGWPRKVIGLLGILSEKMFDRTGNFLDLARHIKEIHLIVFLSHFIW